MTRRLIGLVALWGTGALLVAGCDEPNTQRGNEDCTNNTDDDGDYLVDCLDPDCIGNAACTRSGTEICDNDQDDDNDLKTDCEDFDCTRDPVCRGDEICNNNRDDDNDHREDCDDPDCNGDAACRGTEICGNNQDDDNDGKTDCDDPDCTRSCTEDCSNGRDDDGDNYPDCDDTECCGVGDCAPCSTDPCPAHNSEGCEDCVADYENDCGWCPATSTCSRGNAGGPEEGTCADWMWAFTDCGGSDPCETHTAQGCAACAGVQELECGFCQSSGDCLQGSSTGPSSGTCDNWIWGESQCANPCQVYTEGCGDCTADRQELNCGFCQSSDQCVPGNSTGPSTGTCDDWAYLPSQCGTADPCAVYTEGCAECTADMQELDCGFCMSTGQCLQGSSTGPSSGTCDDWAYFQADCNPCVVYDGQGCAGCTEDVQELDCGFCQSNSQCLQGSSTGPSSGTCSDWAWLSSQCSS